MKQIDSEKIVEHKLVEAVKSNGGIPERKCVVPGAKMDMEEIKTTGRKPKRIQKDMHKKLRALGMRAEVKKSIKGVEQFIDSIIWQEAKK